MVLRKRRKYDELKSELIGSPGAADLSAGHVLTNNISDRC